MKLVKEIGIMGMHCASCAMLISKNLNKLQGISKASVNYSTGKAVVEYESKKISLDVIMKEVEKLGYKPIDLEKDNITITESIERKKEIEELRKNLILSAILSLPVLIISMLNIILPFKNFLLFLLTTIIQFHCGKKIYQSSIISLKNLSPNMDLLIALGTTTAYFYSTITLMNIVKEPYFEISATIITIVLLGRYLEETYKGKMNSAIKKLIELQPHKALVETKKGKLEEIDVDKVNINDIIVVKAGEKIPLDGIIIDGKTHVDESLLTGEPIPVKKTVQDKVYAGSINKEGIIKVKVTKSSKNSLISKIIKAVQKAQASKLPIQRLVDKVSSVFIPFVIITSVLTFLFWYIILGKDLSFALMLAISVLVISCPCALGIATPAAVVVGTGIGAENGILIRNVETLEQIEKINTIVFDKTGTITQGLPKVTDFILINKNYSKFFLLNLTYSLESLSNHPIAIAITEFTQQNKAKKISTLYEIREIEGKGIVGKLLLNNNKFDVEIGKIEESILRSNKFIEERVNKLRHEGKTVSGLFINNKIVAVYGIRDTLREGVKETINELKKMNIKVYLLTGDNKTSAIAIGKETNIDVDKVIAEVLPNQKANYIKKLQENNNFVAMVGDGINDSIALAQANVSIAFGSGSEVAIENSSITIINNDPKSVIKALKIGKLVMNKIRLNLFWAFIYNILFIPIAAGILYPINGILLSPMIASFAMALSSLSVVLNTLHMWLIKL
ncbi:MAG: heavy metal translocating P-type ATPase [Candidatus Anstonellales archaeon]